jgi:TRAP-type uncharacterized transport system substrate-binding protein
MAAHAESQALLDQFLDFLQRDRRIRFALGALLVSALLLLAGRSVYRLVPRHYTLSITGGDIVSNRHYLARILQSEATKSNLTLIVEPVSSGLDTLERVSQGKIDLAFVQGGLEQTFPNVEHVSTVMPELVHLLVKPGVRGMDDLKGRSVNMGIKNSASRSIAQTLLRFAGYAENVDYVETNFTAEQLLGLPLRKMPDAILTVSSVPSYLVEILVRKHQYQVMEIPFPESLALRHGWAANGTILPYTYDLAPPVPAKNIQTVAVNMHLVAHAKVDPSAISRLLEVMYSPSVANRMLQPLDEKRMVVASGYPISDGMTQYLQRNDSFLTMALWNKAQGVFGLVMSLGGMLLVAAKWLKGMPLKVATDDAELLGKLAEVVELEKRATEMESRALEGSELKSMRQRLGALRIQLLERYPKLVLQDPHLFDRCTAAVRASEEHVRALLAAAEDSP